MTCYGGCCYHEMGLRISIVSIFISPCHSWIMREHCMRIQLFVGGDLHRPVSCGVAELECPLDQLANDLTTTDQFDFRPNAWRKLQHHQQWEHLEKVMVRVCRLDLWIFQTLAVPLSLLSHAWWWSVPSTKKFMLWQQNHSNKQRRFPSQTVYSNNRKSSLKSRL